MKDTTENLKLTQQFGPDTFLLLETGKGVVVCRNPLAPTCSPWEISDQAIESIKAFTDVPVAQYGRSVTGDGRHGTELIVSPSEKIPLVYLIKLNGWQTNVASGCGLTVAIDAANPNYQKVAEFAQNYLSK